MATDDRRQRPRLIVTIDPAAGDALEALAAARFGGVKSRAVDACLLIGAAVLSDPATFGKVDPLAALAAHCKRQRGGGMGRRTYNAGNRDDVSAATAFDHGEPFASTAAVRAYFTVENVRNMFGPEDAADLDQATLDAMAAAVLANRWHCAF